MAPDDTGGAIAATDAPPQKGERLADVLARAVKLHRDGDLAGAVALYRDCLAVRPDNATTWTNFGAALRSLGKLEPAIAAHRRALEIAPDSDNARANLANALCDVGDHAEAIAIRRDLLALEPDEPKRIRDLAVALRGAGHEAETIALVNAAEARLGQLDLCRLQRSLAHLMRGEWAEGFADFESRYAGDEVSLPENAPWPRWMGEDLTDKRVLILPEQGFGDAILMARFLPALKARAAHVAMVVKPPLRRLFQRLVGVDELRDGARRSDPYDFYTPNMSLPHLIGFADGIPPLPRLAIPEDSRARAARIVAPFAGRFKIGVVWTGSLTYRANHRRSTEPENFLGLAGMPGVQLFSLYKGDAHERFLESGMAGLIVDACGRDRDFADSAALIDEMDLMITTDTAVVHVAGSLGKPVWNMLSNEGFWLYGRGERTAWYPSMRLFRQDRAGDWPGVFAKVETALAKHLEIVR